MGAIAYQIITLTIVFSTVYSDAHQRKHQGSLAFVRRIHRGPVNSPHKWPVTRKMFPFDDVIMKQARRLPGGMGQQVAFVCVAFSAQTYGSCVSTNFGFNQRKPQVICSATNRNPIAHSNMIEIHCMKCMSQGSGTRTARGLCLQISYHSICHLILIWN